MSVEPFHSPNQGKGDSRVSSLDAVRGFAAILVMISHTCEAAGIFPPLFDPHVSPVIFGVSGVVAFFLVSGFVIPMSLERHRSQSRFWISRVFRIFPLYLVAFAIAVFFMGETLDTKGIVAHLFLLQDYVPGVENVVPNSWTLSIEWVWYAVFAILVALNWSQKTVLVTTLSLVALIAGVVITFTVTRMPMGRIGLLGSCVMGLLAYRMYMNDSFKRNSILSIVLAGTIFIGLTTAFLFTNRSGGDLELPFSQVLLTWGVGYALFYIGLFSPLFKRRNKVLVFLGEISYSVYLLHSFVVVFVVSWLGETWLALPAVFAIALPLSALSYRFIEKPCNAYGSKYAKKFAQRKPQTA
jgi:peptidoglycan/LPS O-acetylase OafA/YrhL